MFYQGFTNRITIVQRVGLIGIFFLASLLFFLQPVSAAGGVRSWNAVASSSDGTKLIAGEWCGFIYTSLDSGLTWTANTDIENNCWSSVASSADGTKLFATSNNNRVYISVDSGLTWTYHTFTNQSLQKIASNAVGDKLIVVADYGSVWTSQDTGATWTRRTSAGERWWQAAASNALGDILVAADNNNGYIYISTDYGATWSSHDNASGTGYWRSISSDSSGGHLIATQNYGKVYLSTDAGITWGDVGLSSSWWQSSVISANGQKIAVANDNNGLIYTSSDYGTSWSDNTASSGTGYWTGLASDSSGDKLFAEINGSQISRSVDAGLTWDATNTIANASVQLTVKDQTGAVLSGVVVQVNCDGTWSDFGTTDTHGVINAVPADAATCNDNDTLAFRFTKSGYLPGETYYDSPDRFYRFDGAFVNYSVVLSAIEAGNTDSYLAEYWNVPNGASTEPRFRGGTPVYSTTTQSIDNTWVNGSPGNGVNPDGFLARYSKTAYFSAGDYLFSSHSDDGIKIYIDGVSIFEDWSNRSEGSPDEQTETLTAGNHIITLEYYENNGAASVHFSYIPTNITASIIEAYQSANTVLTPDAPGSSILFDNALVKDSSYLTTALSQTDDGDDSQVFKYTPSFEGFTTPKFTVNWFGHGAVPDAKKVYLSIWNYLTSAWDDITSAHCGTDCTLTGDKTGIDYKNGDGAVWIKAKADSSFAPTVISGVTANGGLLPIQWTTDQSATSLLAYDTSSHDNWDDYANHFFDNNLVTSHAMTPALNGNNSKNWYSLALNAAGNKAVGGVWCGDIYTGVNVAGVWTWTDQTGSGYGCWRGIASDSTGTKIAAVDGNNGLITLGVDVDGVWTWTPQTGDGTPGTSQWMSIASNTDGTKLIATAYNGYIWTGVFADSTWTWTRNDSAGQRYWYSVTSDSTGTKLAAVNQNNGFIYTSTNGGTDWSTNGDASGTGDWRAIASDASGDKLVATRGDGGVYKSVDAGLSWEEINNSPTGYFERISLSANGSTILTAGDCGYIYTSTNGGDTWTTQSNMSSCWYSTGMSSDGTKMVAGVSGGNIWASANSGSTWADVNGSVYYYRVRSLNAEGNITTSDEYSLMYGLGSSCPFVFTWDGTKYNFIIDASSAATLGSGGELHAWKANPFYKATSYPNPESYVKIPSGFLTSRTVGSESYYDVKTTFELNETNYYDQAALQVVDHSPSVNVFPDYRNNAQIHTISKSAPAPVLVTDGTGRDVTSLISAADNVLWHGKGTTSPSSLTIKLLAGTTTPAHLKLLIKRGKEGNQSGGTGSDVLQYKNSSGVFVSVPSSYNPFSGTRAGAPASSRNLSNTYGLDTKVIDLSGLSIKDNEIRFLAGNNQLFWVIDQLAVDTSADEAVTTTTLAPYAADFHFRGVSELVSSDSDDPHLDIDQPDYAHLAKTVGAGNPLTGYATRYGDVLPLVTTEDDKFVIATQGDELALKYSIPAQADGTERDFLYKTIDYHKSYHAPLGDQIAPLPFKAMTQYPYHTDVEHYPTDAGHQVYQDTYNTRSVSWGVNGMDILELHHSLNTDYMFMSVSEGTVTPPPPVQGGAGRGGPITLPSITPILLGPSSPVSINPLTPSISGESTATSADNLIHVGTTEAPPAIATGGTNDQTGFVAIVSQTFTEQTHHITILSIDLVHGTVTIQVESTPQVFTLKLAGIVSVDLNGDKTPDISIKLADLKSNNAVLNVKSLLGKTVVEKAKAIKNTFLFTRNLKSGMKHADVKELQKFLNANGFLVAKTGTGSPGKESTLFGTATARAIQKFQEANAELVLKPLGLKKGTGNFFEYTRKVVNALKK